MMKSEAITSRDVDFAKWYTDVVKAAKLADYTSVKGVLLLNRMAMLFGKKFNLSWIKNLKN